MNDRAARLIDLLQLSPHPEGGYFREVHRSAARVQPDDGRSERTALTSIYFLLTEGDVSRWHRVASDEAWHFHEGDPLELIVAERGFAQVSRHTLGTLGEHQEPLHVVPAGNWQAARSTGAYTLVGCTVGPGFAFEDFEMLHSRPSEAAALKAHHPDLIRFL